MATRRPWALPALGMTLALLPILTIPAYATPGGPDPKPGYGNEPSPDPTPGPDDEALALTAEVVTLINAERAAHGRGEVLVDELLSKAAAEHAADMAERDFFAHTNLDGETPQDRALRHGYDDYGAENIAWGYSTPERVVHEWMNSTAHRRNILNGELVAIGVGYHNEDRALWVAKFGRSLTLNPEEAR
ncbi:CAP domain-containing protein [Nocardiopsis synnemataformans]|uniref:CAP domain-containing protein n=1 Tax=Nocardiopsis synnemataformans TaxID=61305 RepID=UPI003EB8AC73